MSKNQLKAKRQKQSKDQQSPEEPWFVCLFASIKWVTLEQFLSENLNETKEQQRGEVNETSGDKKKKKIASVKKKSSKKSKTFISVTMNPSKTLGELRNGKISLPGIKKDARSSSNDQLTKVLAANMEIACLVGPIENKEKAFAFRKSWETMSRGLVSRSTTGSVLAKRYKYRCSINWNAFYRLRREDVHIQEKTDGSGNVVSLVFVIIRLL